MRDNLIKYISIEKVKELELTSIKNQGVGIDFYKKSRKKATLIKV
jgi:hypothetical protein